MTSKPFARSGHWPTLLAAFLYFDVSFMVWVLLGPMAPFITEQMKLSATQQGLLTAIPLLGGSLFRPVLGVLADRVGGRRAGLLGLSLTLVPLLLGWRFADQLWHIYAIGFLLGIAGASFAVALPLAGRWYPPEHQGLAMGIAGAGNAGTLLATFFVPRLAQHFGWHAAFGIAILPVACVLVAFAFLAKDSPRQIKPPAWSDYSQLLRQADTFQLCFLYSLTFGGFVGLTSFLTLFFRYQYHLGKVQAGDFTTIAVVAGSFLRPLGGWLSDKWGGYRLLLLLFSLIAICLGAISTLPSAAVVLALFFLAMGMLGMGSGAVFQLAPLRFPREIGIATGIIGAAGGLGGFFLPSGLGVIRGLTGSYGAGLLIFAAVFAAGVFSLCEFGVRWRRRWPEKAIERAGVFAYRGRQADALPILPQPDQPLDF